jgi:hypothetical protein
LPEKESAIQVCWLKCCGQRIHKIAWIASILIFVFLFFVFIEIKALGIETKMDTDFYNERKIEIDEMAN